MSRRGGAPVPDGVELRTDHGPQYTGSDCHDLCQAWDVDHTFAPVGRPTGKAYASHCTSSVRFAMISATRGLVESFCPCILTGGWSPALS